MLKYILLVSLFIIISIVGLFFYLNFDYSPNVEYKDLLKKVNHFQTVKPVKIGLAPYGIRNKNWPCKKFLKALKPLKSLHIATLWDAFGTNNTCLEKLMEDPRLESLEIILITECCVRNRNCTSADFLRWYTPASYQAALLSRDPKLMRGLRRYYKEVKAFLDINLRSTTQCYISPGLESNLNADAMKILINMAYKIFPQCMLVANPVGSGPGYYTGADFREFHGTNLPSEKNISCITDLDGLDIEFPERPSVYNSGWETHIHSGSELQSYLQKSTARCEISFLWTSEMNCLNVGQDTSPRIPPAERECQFGIVPSLMVDQILQFK